jgi:exopolysaccharide biosynthesis polyprenyl glycosylphosphotransferase
MLKERVRLFRGFLLTLDLLLTAISLVSSYLLYPIQAELYFPTAVYITFFIMLTWAVLLKGFRVYRFSLLYTLSTEIHALSKVVLVGGVSVGFTLFIMKEQAVSRQFVLWFLASDFMLLVSARLVIRLINGYLRRRDYAIRNVVIVGDGKRAVELARLIQSTPWWGLKLLGFVSTERSGFIDTTCEQFKILGAIEDLPRLVTEVVVDEVVFVVPRKKLQELEETLLALEEVGINTRIALNFFPHVGAVATVSDLGDVPMISFSTTPGEGFPLLLKGAMDRSVSLMLLTILSPLLLGIALAVKIGSPGPILVRQIRCGLHGRRFDMFTFRTSTAQVSQVHETPSPTAEEVNTVGKWLRKTGTDYLPLIFNVLIGHMSLVGPRLPLPEEVEHYERWQRRRLSMKPGITGLWRINRKQTFDIKQSLKSDLEYIDNWRLKLDFQILLRSILAIPFF